MASPYAGARRNLTEDYATPSPKRSNANAAAVKGAGGGFPANPGRRTTVFGPSSSTTGATNNADYKFTRLGMAPTYPSFKPSNATTALDTTSISPTASSYVLPAVNPQVALAPDQDPILPSELPKQQPAAVAPQQQPAAVVQPPRLLPPRQSNLPSFSPVSDIIKPPPSSFWSWSSAGRFFSAGSNLAIVSGLVLGTKTIAEYLFPASTAIQVLIRVSGSIIGYRLLSWISNWSTVSNDAIGKIARAANEKAAEGQISAQSLKELQQLMDVYDTSIIKLENLLAELPQINKDDVVITGAQYSDLLSLVTEIEVLLSTGDQLAGTNHSGDKNAKLRQLRDRYKDALLNTLQANPKKREDVEKAFTKLDDIPRALNVAPHIPVAPQPQQRQQQQPLQNNFNRPAPIQPQKQVSPPLPLDPSQRPKPLPLIIPRDVKPLQQQPLLPPPAPKPQPKAIKTSPRPAKPKGYTPKPRKAISGGVKKNQYSPSTSAKKAAAANKKRARATPIGAPRKRKSPGRGAAGSRSPKSPGRKSRP